MTLACEFYTEAWAAFRWRPTMADIIAETALDFGLTVADIKSGRRAKAYSWPRQESMVRCFQAGYWSQLQIARAHGLTDHTSVVHARLAVERRRAARDGVE